VHALGASGTGTSSRDVEEAWSLLSDREAIERAMTAIILVSVARAHGVQIAGPASR